MKRTISALMLLLLLVSLCSCGDEGKTNVITEQNTSAAVTEAVSDLYTFQYNGVTIRMNDIMEGSTDGGLRAKLGEPDKYEESNSCAYLGLDKVYTYPGFTIYTYPDNGVDYVLTLVFNDDTVQTPSGLMVGSAAGDVAKAYGAEWDGKDGRLSYSSGNTSISFQITGGVVKKLQYDYKTN